MDWQSTVSVKLQLSLSLGTTLDGNSRVSRRASWLVAVGVCAAVAAVVAAPSALGGGSPGGQAATYIAAHLDTSERHAFEGVALSGGRAQVADGTVAARGVTLSVLTTLPNTTAGERASYDFCVTAAAALRAQPRLAATIGNLRVLGRRVRPDGNGDGGGRRILAFRAIQAGTARCVIDRTDWATAPP